MLLKRYSPQAEACCTISPLQRFQDDIERLFGSSTPSERTWSPSMDVVEAKESFVVSLELPGVKAADVKVTLEDDVLTVSGERKFESAPDAELRFSERSYGKFQRSVHLPAPVQMENVKATSKDGILTITLPKTEEAKPREIKITTA